MRSPLLSGAQVIRIDGIYGHHNYSAVIYALLICFCVTRRMRFAAIVFLWLGLLTGSNAFYIYLAMGLAASIANLGVYRICLAGLFIFIWFLPFWYDGVMQLLSSSQYEALALFTNFRSVHWAVYTQMSKDFLFSGVGFDGSLDLYREYVKHSLGWFDHEQIQHNMALDILLSLGLLGWVVMGIAVFLLLFESNEVSGILCCNDRGTYLLFNGMTFIGLWLGIAFWLSERGLGNSAIRDKDVIE